MLPVATRRYQALNSNTTGVGNTAVGHQAGFTSISGNANTTGISNTFIGYNSGPGTATQLTGATAIGANAKVTTNYSIVLGDTGSGAVNVGIGTTAPTQALDLIGNLKFSQALMPNGLAGTAGQVLTSGGAGVAPTWSSTGSNLLDGLTDAAVATPAAGQVLVYNGTTDFQNRSLSGDISAISGTGGVTLANSSTTRTNLGLGSLATLSAITSTEITDLTIGNADINSSAAIAGTKISPAFGAQNISTTGTLTSGATTVTDLTIGTSAWPANTSGVLTNNGTGTLTWEAAGSNSLNGLTDAAVATPAAGQVLVYNGTTDFQNRALSGDISAVSNTGAVTLATISTPGKVSGNAITSGTIGGTTIINTSGNIATSGTGTLTVAGISTLKGAIGLGATPDFGTTGNVLTSQGVGVAPIWSSSGSGWGLTGNSTTDSTVNFVGTISNQALVFKTNSTEQGKINALGNFRIGNNPTTYSSTNQASLEIYRPSSSSRFRLLGPSTQNQTIQFYGVNGAAIEGWAILRRASDNSLRIQTNTNTAANLTGTAAGTDMIYILPTGKVGIINSSPTEALDVAGNVRFSGALMPNGLVGTTGQVLQSNGMGAPTWVNAASNSLNGLTDAAVATPAAGQVLVYNGTTDFQNRALSGDISAVSNTGAVTLTNSAGTRTNLGLGTVATLSTITSTEITDLTIVNADINAAAAIVDTKLATISTAGKVSNSATTAASANTANAIVARDASGNFSAGTITATLVGNASTATTVTTNANLSGDVTSSGSNVTAIVAGVIVDADINASGITTAGKVSGSAITSGTIGGSTAINTSGNITTTGTGALNIAGTSTLKGAIGLGATPDFGTAGKVLTSQGAGVAATWSTPSSGWGLSGNSGTVDGTNFIGTSDDSPLNIKINNQQSGRIDRVKQNAFYGYLSGSSNVGGFENTAFGHEALKSNLGGRLNTAVGYRALYNNTDGEPNTAFGSEALLANTTGPSNTAVGYYSLHSNTTGGYNSAFGENALLSNQTGEGNVAIGSNALYGSIGAHFNVGIGTSTLANTTSGWNLAIAGYALNLNTTGSNNIGIGFYALGANTTGTGGTAIGYGALDSNTTGWNNTAIGSGALNGNSLGTQNFAGGTQSIPSLEGSNNTALGAYSGYSVTTGDNITLIGAGTSAVNGLTNATALGYQAAVGASNSLVLGGTSSYAVNVGIGTTAPSATLHAVGNFLVSGSTGGLPATGAGNRAMWYPAKYAFRAGSVSGVQWDDSNIGSGSVAFGYNSTASGSGSTCLGLFSTATGTTAFAAGNNATSNGTGSFALGDATTASSDYSFVLGRAASSSSTDQMTMKFANGYRLYTNSGASVGVSLAAGGNSWAAISDSTKKERIVLTDGEFFLDKISRFKLGSWNYIGQDPKTMRHYGPMAQDFFAAFGYDGVGTVGNDTLIASADFDGVNFIAIQALEKRTSILKAAQIELSTKASLIDDLKMENLI